MTCHYGHTLHHATFALLHLVLFAWFVRKPTRAKPFLRAVVCLVAVGPVLYHIVLGGVCTSTSVLDALVRTLGTDSCFRCRAISNIVRHVLFALIASHFICEEDHAGRLTKLFVVNGAALLLPMFVLWNWHAVTQLFEGLRPLAIVSMLISGCLMYSVVRSRVLLVSVFVVPFVIVTVFGQLANFVLDEGFILDELAGRVVPRSPVDEVHPHLVAVLWNIAFDTLNLQLCGAFTHAVASHYSSTHSMWFSAFEWYALPSLAESLLSGRHLRPKTSDPAEVKQRGDDLDVTAAAADVVRAIHTLLLRLYRRVYTAWFLLPILTSLAMAFIFPSHLPNPRTVASLSRNASLVAFIQPQVRELLSIDTEQDTGVLWLLLPCCGLALLVILVVVQQGMPLMGSLIFPSSSHTSHSSDLSYEATCASRQSKKRQRHDLGVQADCVAEEDGRGLKRTSSGGLDPEVFAVADKSHALSPAPAPVLTPMGASSCKDPTNASSDRMALSFLTDGHDGHTSSSCSSTTGDTDVLSPIASVSELEEHQTDPFEGFRGPAPLCAAGMDQIECYLTQVPTLSCGDGSMQCEFVVRPNFRRRCYSDDCANCSLCGQHKAALAHDLAVLVEGRADPHCLAEGATARVCLLYGVAHSTHGTDDVQVTPLKTLGKATLDRFTGPVFRMFVAENRLQTSRKAVNEAKRDWASGKTRDIYACMIAEVTTENGQNGHDGPGSPSQAVFVSPELYVCSERNLRKQCTPARRL